MKSATRTRIFGFLLALIGCSALTQPSLSTAAFSDIEAAPGSLSFPSTVVGSESPAQTVVFTNNGAEAVAIEEQVIAESEPDFVIKSFGCGGELQPGDSCEDSVAFTPQAAGPRGAVLLLEPTNSEEPIEVNLEGEGVRKAIDLPSTSDFGTATKGESVERSVSVENNGGATVAITKFELTGANSADFTITNNTCPGTLGPAMNCELKLRFTPSTVGAEAAELKAITDGIPAEPVAQLSGEGVAAELTFEPAGYDFGLVEVHSESPRTNFTLRNTGPSSVQLSNLEISGPQASEFWIPGSGCWGTNLAPGSTCGIEVQFNANQEGDAAAAVRISAGGTTFEAPLTARAERPRVTPSEAPFRFAPTSVGASRTRQLTMTNVGNLPVGFFIAIVSGGDVSSFHLIGETCTTNVFAGAPHLIAPGESCSAEIRFEPNGPGPKAATLSFFGGGEGALQVPIEGDAVAPRVTLSPSSHDFGSVTAGSTSPVQTFELLNESADPYAVDSASIAGAAPGEFQIRADGCSEESIEPGASCAVAVRFDPESAGHKTATLRLRGAGGSIVAGLSGDGNAAIAAAPPAVTRGGRVTFTVSRHPRSTGGSVTIGRAYCRSSAECVIRLSGSISGRAAGRSRLRPTVRGVAVSTIRLAAGTSGALTTRLPTGFRAAPAGAGLRITVNWWTGQESGANHLGLRVAAEKEALGQRAR
jgi:hypothetical protein